MMPDNNSTVNRVYDIKIQGYDAAAKNLKDLTSLFNKLDETKRKTDEQLKKAIEAGNAKTIEQLSAKLKDLETQLKNLDKTRQQSAKEVEALAKAEKLEADAKLVNAKATKEAASAEAIKTKSIIDQNKELDRQIDREEKQAKASAKTKEALVAEAGSYKDIVAQMKELRPFVQNTSKNSSATIDFKGQTIGIAEATAKFKELSLAEGDFRRQFAKDGLLVAEYSSGIIQAFKDLGVTDIFKKQRDDITGQINQIKQQNKELAEQYKQTAQAGGEGFDKIGKELQENINLQQKLEKNLLNINSALDQTGGIGMRVTQGIKEGFQGLYKQATQFALSYVGIQAVFSSLSSGVDTAKELSDQTSNLEVELGKAKGGAQGLVDQLAKLDTRTKLTVLEDIANIAAKAGVSEDRLVGVTAAIDKIKIAFGKDFGDVEGGTESLVKLINIFEGSDKVTGDNLLKVGNAVRTLANESVASVPFLNDFSKRMAGLKGISDISLPAVLGLGSGFEQFGQSAEVAGTTLQKVIPKLGTDTEKYGKIAGLTQQAFSALLKDNPAEALIKVSEGLVKSGSGIEEISKSFADSNLGSGRIAAILGTVGAKADDFRKSIASAGKAYQDTSNIETAFAAKNDNLAATLDKISKTFADAANSTAFRVSLTAIATILTFLIGNLGIIIGALALYAATWSIANYAMIAARVSTIAANVAFTAQYAVMVIGQTVTRAYATAVAFLSTVMGEAAVTSTVLSTAIKILAGPLGIVLAVVGLLTISFTAFGKTVTGASTGLSEYIRQQNILREISKKANDAVAEQTSTMAGWISVLLSAAASADTKRLALQKLIDIDPAFRGALKGQAIDLQSLNRIYQELTANIRAKAEAEASASLTAEKQKDVLSVTSVRQKLETEFARGSGGVRTISGLSDDEISKIFNGLNLQSTSARQTGNGAIQFTAADFAKIKANLNRQEDLAIAVFNDYATAQGVVQARLAKMLDETKKKTIETTRQTADNSKLSVAELQELIKGIDEEYDTLKEGDPKLKELGKKRDEYQARLDALNGKDPKKGPVYKGSRLSGETKDQFKDIDAQKNELIAQAEQFYAEGKLNEQDYLNDILKINQDAIDAKLNKLIKPANAAERIEVANLHKERIDKETETNKKLFDLYSKDAEAQLKSQQRANQATLDAVINNPNSSFTQKATARQDFNFKELAAQQSFNNVMDSFERRYNQKSVANEQNRADALKKVLSDIRLQRLAELDAEIHDLQKKGDEALAKTKVIFNKQREEILKSKKSPEEKKAGLAALDQAEQIAGLTTEIDAMKAQLPLLLSEIGKREDAQERYAEFYAQYVRKIEELSKLLGNSFDTSTIQGKLSSKLSAAFGFDIQEGDSAKVIEKKVAEQKLLGQTIADTYQFAQNAMNSYFDAERQQIEASKQAAYERIDTEKEIALAHAQSQAEKDAIDKKAAADKKEADKKAFEENKKLQIAQAEINLAMQLSNLAVVAFSPNPLNIATLGAAGAIMYGIQAAAALANFALNVARINAQQFATGGMVLPNGKVTTSPNIPTQSNGDNVLATVRPGEVLLNEQQQAALGGARTFAAIGVPGFAGGGLAQPLGGRIPGQNLLPPWNPQSFINGRAESSSVSADVNELKRMVATVAENVNSVSNRVDNIKVINVATETDAVLQQHKKASSIGVL